MKITNRQIYNEASAILRSLYGESACFRDGQYEAIEATLLNRRTLVVQRTGWGKSLVYFACTKLLRNRGAGTTFVVSPLLVLIFMRSLRQHWSLSLTTTKAAHGAARLKT